jgi:hypothetical protein
MEVSYIDVLTVWLMILIDYSTISPILLYFICHFNFSGIILFNNSYRKIIKKNNSANLRSSLGKV